MTRWQAGGYTHGDTQADLRDELVEYSRMNVYLAHRFADAVCVCGGREFLLLDDEEQGVAVRVCGRCGDWHPIGDSADYLAGARLEEHECMCGVPLLEITVGVSLYEEGRADDVRWLYLGARCPACGMLGCYADWKNQHDDWRALLANV